MSPEPSHPPARRLRPEVLLHIGLAIAGSLLIARLVHIQVVRADQFSGRATRQQISRDVLPARAGDLFDRHGRLLATTVSAPSLYVNPQRVEDVEGLAVALAKALSLDADALRERLERNADRQFLWIRRRLTDEQAAAVRRLNLPADLAGFRREFQRHYPQGPLAAHVLGLRDIDGVGRGGVEEALDGVLRGQNGTRQFVRDARGFMLDVLEEVTVPPAHGASVTLTIDILLQGHVEQRLDVLMEQHRPRGACAIVLDPRTGEILALASRPTFDPNRPGAAAEDAWKNLAVSAVFEPGSTFKPLVVAWGVDRGLLDPEEEFDCERGVYRMGRRLLHDHHRYGLLTVADILVKSSNIGMAKIGEQLGNEQLFLLATRFGFGQRTGVELPGELPGILRPLHEWDSYSTGSTPMGHELAATPLQLIAAHAVLANGGVRMTPHLLFRVDGAAPPRQVVVSRILDVESANWIVRGPLVEVVERGTGKLAQLPGVAVFGKTGTAQKLKLDGRGYAQNRHVSSFVCGAPAENPLRLVLVSVDEPHSVEQFGGAVAAPCAAAILSDSLRLAGE